MRFRKVIWFDGHSEKYNILRGSEVGKQLVEGQVVGGRGGSGAGASGRAGGRLFLCIVVTEHGIQDV